MPKQTDKIQPKSEPNLDGFYFFHDPNLEKSIFKSQGISHRKALQTRYEAEEISQVVSKHFGISSDELIERKWGGSDLIIHLLKNKTGMTTREIGDPLGSLTYAGVSRVYKGLSKN